MLKMSNYDMSIHSSTDAREWTDFFFKTYPNCNVDRETMLGWFANAMMAMHDNERKVKIRQGLDEYKKGYVKAEEDLKGKAMSKEQALRILKLLSGLEMYVFMQSNVPDHHTDELIKIIDELTNIVLGETK
jgi:hypothetical protein